MAKNKYSPALIEQVLKELDITGDIELVSRKHNVPPHAIYRFRREKLKAPSASKENRIKELSKELAEKDLEIKILRELLKKTYQVMPIESL
jgi:predicted RNase H-like nuclease (RuvC/YqgF family)